jgi:hypothetical protein
MIKRKKIFFSDSYFSKLKLKAIIQFEKVTHIIDSNDGTLINNAIGYRCAAYSLLIAFPLTSSIQCLP